MSTNSMMENLNGFRDYMNVDPFARQRVLVDLMVDFWQLVKDEQGYVIGRLVGEKKAGEADING